MRILLIHNKYRQAGGEDVVFHNEMELLRSYGNEVHAYCEDNRRIDTMNCFHLGVETIWSESSRRKLLDVLHKFAPDLAHFHNTFPLISPSAYSACREVYVPIVQTLHNYRLLCPAATFFRDGQICEECVDRSLWRSFLYGCYRHSRPATAIVAAMLAIHRRKNTWLEMVDCFIALTEFSRNKFIDAGFPKKKLAIKPNFLLQDPGERSGSGEYALFLGRLSPEKGLNTLLSAWRQLSCRQSLRIAGDGPLRANVERLASMNGVSNVQLIGALSHDDAIKMMREARFLVFPSEWYECFPMTLVESFACGVPVIASRLGAMAEIVDDGRTGLHFTPGDAEDLAAKIRWAWTHPAEMEAMGHTARAEYERKYSAEQNYYHLTQIYARLLKVRQCYHGASVPITARTRGT